MSAKELLIPMPWGHIAAKAWGSPNDERVLVVHGILDNAGAFDRLISLLPRGYYFVCIDLPGHGLSSHMPAGIPLDFLNYVLCIRRVLDYLKWDTCVYMGHSLGANVGFMFSAIYPERVTKLLCIDAVTSRPLPNSQLIPWIQGSYDHTLSINEEGANIPTKFYTKEEVMYMLMNLRKNALNFAAAEALMKRSVTKVGEKYKFNRDRRLKGGSLPLLNSDQHITMVKEIEIPVLIIFASSTINSLHDKEFKKVIVEISLRQNYTMTAVEGNHDVHNNHPERLVPHVRRFLGNIKSSL